MPLAITLETAILRRSMHAREAREDRCRDCHRTPLVGERVYEYGPRIVCELCLPLRREAPTSSRLVHSPEHERAVRIRRAA